MQNLSLKAAAAALSQGEIALRGGKVKAKVLTMRQVDRIMEAIPEPVPQAMIPDTTRGSLAPKVRDYQDEAYMRERHVWLRKRERLFLAVACGFTVEQSSPAQGTVEVAFDVEWPAQTARAWCEAADRLMADAFTELEVKHAFRELMELMDTGKIAREALLVELPEERRADDPEAYQLPKRYGITENGVLLRICRTYRLDPFKVMQDPMYDNPGMWALLREQQRIFNAEEAGAVVPGPSAD